MKVLVVEPQKPCRVQEIESLADMQQLVGGDIEAVYPFQELVAVVCNADGKALGLPMNRPLLDKDYLPYIVRLIDGTPIRARPSQEIKDLRTEIHHIGNNINQIARSVNAGIATAEDARRGLFLLDKVYELMYQVANP